MTRIAIIGGGSAYMPGLAFSFARERERFGGATIVLHDIDGDALDVQQRLTGSILKAGGGGITVEATTDLERGLDGADFVLTTFRPGGYAARHLDEAIPPRHGIVGQETTGPGGLAMAFRSVPALLRIAEQMRERAAPRALLLNYTNPVQVVTTALLRHGGVPVIGLCDQHRGEIRWLAGIAGVDPALVETDIYGTNHLTFTPAVRVDGRDITSELCAHIGELDPATLDAYWAPVARMLPLFGMVVSNYLKYFVLHDEMLEASRRLGMTRSEQIQLELPAIIESYRREADADDPRPLGGRYSAEHGDYAVGLMGAVISGEPSRFVLNVPNRGAISDLPDDAVVEVPCMLHGREITRQEVGPLPAAVSGLARQMVGHAELAAEAAATGDRGLALRAMMAHPLVHSLSSGQAVLDELLDAHAEDLPQFA